MRQPAQLYRTASHKILLAKRPIINLIGFLIKIISLKLALLAGYYGLCTLVNALPAVTDLSRSFDLEVTGLRILEQFSYGEYTAVM